ncbi:hypothetical protein [Actinomadura rugatobispora]|uniref:Uncharacterized protein n=1 Tax=Actinomadura rugatobispora TaxID=1994 RepID=A0ABW1AD20_9ACTN|nr:hypothetical protein GCM10010200_066390 [Actinomadura rugatobispora]
MFAQVVTAVARMATWFARVAAPVPRLVALRRLAAFAPGPVAPWRVRVAVPAVGPTVAQAVTAVGATAVARTALSFVRVVTSSVPRLAALRRLAVFARVVAFASGTVAPWRVPVFARAAVPAVGPVVVLAGVTAVAWMASWCAGVVAPVPRLAGS